MFDPRATQIASSYQNLFDETATKLGELAKVLVELALSKIGDKEEDLSKARVQIGSDNYVLSPDPDCPGAWKWEKVDLTNNVNQTNNQAVSVYLTDFQAQTLASRLVLQKPEPFDIDVVSDSEPAIRIVAYTDSGAEIDVYEQDADGICTKNLITENLSDEEIINVAYEPLVKLLPPSSSILENSETQNIENSKAILNEQPEEELSEEEVAQILSNVQQQFYENTNVDISINVSNEEIVDIADTTVSVDVQPSPIIIENSEIIEATKAENLEIPSEENDPEELSSEEMAQIVNELLAQVVPENAIAELQENIEVADVNRDTTTQIESAVGQDISYLEFPPIPPEEEGFVGFLEDIPLGEPPEEELPPDTDEGVQLISIENDGLVAQESLEISADIEVKTVRQEQDSTLSTQAVLVRDTENSQTPTTPLTQAVLVRASIENTRQDKEETSPKKETINSNFRADPTLEEIEDDETKQKKSKPAGAYTYEQVGASENVNPETKRWAKQVEVPIYATSLWNLGERKRVNAENVKIAEAAKEMLKAYGSVEADGSRVYRSDAFVIKKDGENFSIHHRRDELNGFNNPLMQFKLDKKGNGKVQSPPKEMSPVERQEFLMVAEYLEEGKKLPSLRDSDLRDVANTLGSLAPAGTFKTLESFRQTEVLGILNSALQKANTDQLTIGEFTIVRTRDPENNKANLLLYKTTEEQGRQELVNFELQKTENGVTKEVKKMNISDWDLTQLKFINQNAKAFDLDKFFEKEPQHPQNEPKVTPTEPQRPQEVQNIGEIPVKIHPYIEEEWKKLQNSKQYWAGATKQGNEYINKKIQEGDGKLPISEQREMYFKIMMAKVVEAELKKEQVVDFVPLKVIMKNLESWRKEEITNKFTPKTEIPNQEKYAVKISASSKQKEEMSL